MRRGEGVRVVTTKWGDRPHWEFAGRYLGADGHGHWIGFPAGSRFARPGSEFVAEHDHVTLVPGHGGYLATFWPTQAQVEVPVEVYVDVATPPRWDGDRVHTVDLDLDVVRRPGGEVSVDDEDEFDEHRVLLAYPDEVVAAARATCARLVTDLTHGLAPYDGLTSDRWLAVLAALPPVSGDR